MTEQKEDKQFISEISNLLNKTNNRLNWNEYFMAIALLASQRSSCDRLHVGCIIVKNNRLLCMGYNGFIQGGPHTSRIRNNHEQCTVHAEQNAVSDAASRGVSISNAIAYITHFPCINCFKTLVSANIRTIYYNSDYKNDPIVKEMAVENNIQIIKIN